MTRHHNTANKVYLHLLIRGDHAVRDITAESSADHAAAIHRHARGILGSSRVDIELDADQLGGTVYSHGLAVGTFTLEHHDVPPTVKARASDGIKWGYTLQDLDQLTRRAILRNAAYFACDTDERYASAWHAAVEHLLTAEEQPTMRDLTNVAWRAADNGTRRTAEHRGRGRSRGDGSRSDGATVRFWAYWDRDTRITPSPEAGIVDRVACAQIWPRLTPREQQAVETLAAIGDYQKAADALGLSYQAFHRRLRDARARFLALWVEGETPTRRWSDRRIQTENGKRGSMSSTLRRRRRNGAAA